jgi:MFS family permease
MSKNIRYLIIESGLTQFILFMPVAYLLFSEIGLNQFQIGLLQAMFGVISFFLEVPFGYLADKFSKKTINALGDLFIAVAMLCYFFLTNFWQALFAELLLGIGFSLTNGADSALLKAHCQKENRNYSKLFSQMHAMKYSLNAVGAVVGGVVGAKDIRIVFLIQSVLFLGAFLFSFKVEDAGEKRVSEVHPVRDLLQVTKYCLRGHSELAYRIIFSAFLGASTYYIVWFQTPIMLEAGIQIKFHGLIFGLASLVSVLGSYLVSRKITLSFLSTLLLLGISYLMLGANIELYTVLLILVSSFARGSNFAKITPYIQEETPNDLQSTSISVYQMVYRMFSVTLVLLVSYMGKLEYEYGLLTAGAICLIGWAIFMIIKRSIKTS